MIFVASLSKEAKKAFPGKCKDVSLSLMVKALNDDPAISHMEIALLGPRDITGPVGKQFPQAVASKHPDVCVIYMCTNEREAKKFPGAPHVKQVRKIEAEQIAEAVKTFYGAEVRANNPTYTSKADTVEAYGDNPAPANPIVPTPAPVEQEPPKVEEFSVEPVAMPGPPETPPTAKAPTAEEMIASVKEVKDWDVLKRQIERDNIIRELIQENNEFAGISNMLDVWDLRIRDIWADNHKSNEEKLAAVKEFGANRQMLQATHNSVLVDKFISVMELIVSNCVATVDERCESINRAVMSVRQHREEYIANYIAGGEDLTSTLFDKTVELQNILGEMCKMFAFLDDKSENDIIGRLNEKLPSTNEYINQVLSESAKLFYPTNSVDLANKVLDALSSGQCKLSLVEDKVNALMRTIFDVILCQGDRIAYQEKVISLLRANHVEDIVVRDSLLKECFSIFVGTERTGLSSTVATYAGMLSRRANTLVVDLTEHSHYDRYGYPTVELDEFLVDRKQQPLLVVTGSVNKDPERIFHLMEEMKSRLTYYRHVIVVLDASQTMELEQLGRDALTISYVTNCTPESMSAIESAYAEGRKLPNVGNKLVCIDSPVNASALVTDLKMDISMTQLVPIPYLTEMRKAAIVHQQPHTYDLVLRAYEEAFRV